MNLIKVLNIENILFKHIPVTYGLMPDKKYLEVFPFYHLPLGQSVAVNPMLSPHSSVKKYSKNSALLTSIPFNAKLIEDTLNNIYSLEYNPRKSTSEIFTVDSRSALSVITGTITKHDEILPLANVYLFDRISNNLMRSTTSDSEGVFTFTDLQKNQAVYIVAFDSKGEMNAVVISRVEIV